jgi:hypothetical protein
MNIVSNTVSALVLRIFDMPRIGDQSLQAVALLSCFGLTVSLALVGLGFDLGFNLGSAWV